MDFETTMHMPIVPFFALLLVFLIARSFFHYVSLHRFARKHGCGRLRKEDSLDPIGIAKAFQVIKQFRKNSFLEYTHKLFEKYGETYCSTLLGHKMIFTSDPRNIKHILVTGFADFDSSAMKGPLFEPITAHGIFNSEGAKWKNLRELFRYQFSNTRAISDLEMYERHVQHLLQRLSASEKSIDLHPIFMDLAADVISSFAIGHSLELLASKTPPEKQNFAADMRLVRDQISRDGYLGPLRYLFNRQPFFTACQNIQQHVDIFAQRVLHSRRSKRLYNHSRRPSASGYFFLDGLASHTQDSSLLRDNTISVLIAGVDAVASLLSAIFWLLARDPRVYAKLRADILASIGPTDAPTYDQLRSLRYMRCVFKEGPSYANLPIPPLVLSKG